MNKLFGRYFPWENRILASGSLRLCCIDPPGPDTSEAPIHSVGPPCGMSISAPMETLVRGSGSGIVLTESKRDSDHLAPVGGGASGPFCGCCCETWETADGQGEEVLCALRSCPVRHRILRVKIGCPLSAIPTQRPSLGGTAS